MVYDVYCGCGFYLDVVFTVEIVFGSVGWGRVYPYPRIVGELHGMSLGVITWVLLIFMGAVIGWGFSRV